MKAIEVRNVEFSYGERKALKGVDLEIPPGKMFCLLGPNGGGKSTLLKLLCTLETPERGSVHFFGNDVRLSPKNVRSQIGVVFQNPALDKKLTVLENLEHHGHLYRLSPSQIKKRSGELLNFLGLADRRDENTETLSGGLKRRVEIAKSLLHKPRILILDEPTTGLDPLVRHSIWRDLKRQQEIEGTTIVFTTHLLEEADDADLVAMIDMGKIVALGTPSDLKASLGEETLSIRCKDSKSFSEILKKQWGLNPLVLENEIRIQGRTPQNALSQLTDKFREHFETLTLGRPTLEDLFLQKTGRRISAEGTTQWGTT